MIILNTYQLTKWVAGIIHLLCRGMGSKQTAASLFLSELIINTHRRNILRKQEIKNVAGLVNFAEDNQLL